MKESDYHERMRGEVIRRGIVTYERQGQNDINGIFPLHRPKVPTNTKRRSGKKEKMDGGLDIKVVEKAGIKIGKVLPGLKGKEDCGREDCFVHTTGG